MPKEETIQQIKIRNTIGERKDLPSLSPRSSLISRERAILTKFFGVPQLIHLYGALGLNSTLDLSSGDNYIVSSFSDGTFLYVGLNTQPGKIVKIDLATFTIHSTLTLASGEDNVTSLISDGTNIYAGLNTTPGAVVKIELASFTKVSTLVFGVGENSISTLASDGTFLYAGLDIGLGGMVVKIDLLNFTQISTLLIGGANPSIKSSFYDGKYLYIGIDTTPGKLIQIDLATFTIHSTLTLAAGENGIYSLFSDGLYLYAGLNTNPGAVAKIDLITFTKVSTLVFVAGENFIYSLHSDETYLYAGTNTTPGKLITVDLATFTEVYSKDFDAGENVTYTMFSDGVYLYTGMFTTPGKVTRTYIIPFADLYQRKIDTTKECICSILSASTSAGAADGSTVIDTERTEGADYWKNMTLLIMGGSYRGQARKISGFNAVTDTYTVTPVFGGQILSRVRYAILPSTESASSPLVVTDILADSIPFNGADIPIIKGDTQTIEDSTLKADPTAGSLSRYIASGGTALGTQLPASKSLYDAIALDRLDNATYGLSAIETLVDDLETAVGTIEGATTLHNKLTAARATLLDFLSPLYYGLVSPIGQATGGSITSITLEAGASATNDLYNGRLITIYTGTGANQTRTISSYSGGTKIATVLPKWTIAPDNTSYYVITASGNMLSDFISVAGLATAGSASTITLAVTASGIANCYVGQTLSIISGTGGGQTRTIISYDAGTKVTTISPNWSVNPDNTSNYIVFAEGSAIILNPSTRQLVGNYGIDLATAAELGTGFRSVLTDTRIGYIDELSAANLPADIDIIKADTQTIEDSTLKAAPTAGSLARFIASGGTALGTQLPASKSLYDVIVVDRLSGAETISSYNLPNDLVENTAIEIITGTRQRLDSVWLDFVNLVQNVTIKVYHKIDGINYRQYDTYYWTTVDEKGVLITDVTINNDWKLTITSAVVQGGVKAIPYNIIKTVME